MDQAQAKPLRRSRRWSIVALLVLVETVVLAALSLKEKPSSASAEARMCRDCYMGIFTYDYVDRRYPRNHLTEGRE